MNITVRIILSLLLYWDIHWHHQISVMRLAATYGFTPLNLKLLSSLHLSMSNQTNQAFGLDVIIPFGSIQRVLKVTTSGK